MKAWLRASGFVGQDWQATCYLAIRQRRLTRSAVAVAVIGNGGSDGDDVNDRCVLSKNGDSSMQQVLTRPQQENPKRKTCCSYYNFKQSPKP